LRRADKGRGPRRRLPERVRGGDRSLFDPIPEEASYRFPDGNYAVKYGGYSFEFSDPEQAGRFSVGHYIHYVDPDSYGGEALLRGTTSKDGDGVFDDETALILRKGDLFFVNGGFLHLDASSVLANILAGLRGKGPVYNRPSYGYLTNGESRAVFYAPYEVEVDLNLLVGGTQITEFDESGRRVEPGVRLVDGRLRGRVGKFHLVVVS
jgi:hypothetical protein